MVVPVDAAINAYSNVAKSFAGTGQTVEGSGDSVGSPSFSSFIAQSLQNAIDVQHNSEEVSAKALVHKATANDVVVAVNQAEVTLQEVSAIRDKVVSAYEDILRMPI